MPRLEAASISITSGELPAADLEATGAHAAGRGGRALDAVQAARQNAGNSGLPGAALAGKNVAVRDALLRDGVFERGADVLLADQLGKRLRPVFPGDDLVHEGVGGEYARPRVIRGTRAKPLPLLPSGPGGVYSRPLHEARSLTTSMLACGVGKTSSVVSDIRRYAHRPPRACSSAGTQGAPRPVTLSYPGTERSELSTFSTMLPLLVG